MTLKFIDGFESYNDVDDFRQVWVGSGNNGNLTFPTEGRRSGTKCLKWSADYSNTYVYSPINTNTFAAYEYAIIGFALKVSDWDSSYVTEFFFDNGSAGGGGGMGWAFLGNNHTISIRKCDQFGMVEIGFIEYEPDSWNYFEAKVKIGNGTDGHIVVRLNEQEMINWTGDNKYTGPTGFQISRFGAHFHSYYTFLIDDLYVAGSEGSYNNDFLGDVRIDVINPNGAGNYTDLTPSAGANYECVDEAIIDESDYVEGANVGEKDSYSYADVPTDLDDASIFGIDIRNISQRTAGSDNIKIDALLRTGSTDYNSASEISLTDSWTGKDFMFEKDPSDSGDWTQAKINACEFGVEVA